MPRSRQIAFTSRSDDFVNTAPLGLFGEIVTTARVRLVMARSIASSAQLIPLVGRHADRPAAGHLDRPSRD